MRDLIECLWDLLFPPKCVFCHQILDQNELRMRVCSRCSAAQNLLHGRVKGEFFEYGVSCFRYAGNVRKSIHRFKFGGRKEYARVYAGYLLAHLEGEADLRQVDLITSAPTNRKHIRKRGYDHTALLARYVSEELELPMVEALKKTRETKAMYGLRSHERRANILGSIEIACSPEQIVGKQVLLVDDIFTTGATAGECSRVLKMAGAAKVYVITVAKTDNSY